LQKKTFTVCTTEEFDSFSKKTSAKKTITSVSWAYRAFEEWIEHSSTISGCFGLEVKQNNGDSYMPMICLTVTDKK
jgi:hypothetical protein